ncbi:hypothetical protein F3J20_01950 [Paraburkholderia sp. Cy-641]|uniref:hypothetical protein n=1 Tax=Paraburkholderia sp. Cy-641 TaxID=2608337 RepID=UPI001422A90B|nr:hypothetical protein [Paraburkholderia sp. Cy-641]NIF76166.1 hypothetical protein [Paraburkholderia sp. Cy-641]
MPAPKTYTKAQWDEFARLLDALPEKPPSERRLTIRDAMPKVRGHINAARAKGYSVEQLVDQARQAGIDVRANTLRYALQEKAKRRTDTRKARSKANPLATHQAPRASDQRGSLSSRTETGSVRGKTGAMVISDAYSFPIRPDTEDL